MAGSSNGDSSSNSDHLASFDGCYPCHYNRGQAITIRNLGLSHDGGRGVLFRPSGDVILKHGCVVGLVGTNGAGKTSLARVLASKELPGFPRDIAIEYLAASDDEEYLAGTTSSASADGDGSNNSDSNNNDIGDYESTLALRPAEYVRRRVAERSDRLRRQIEDLELRLEGDPCGGDEEDGRDDDVVEEGTTIEEVTDRLSDLYDLEEALTERVERELDHSLVELGLSRHADKPLSALSSGWRYKCRLVAGFLTHPDLLVVDEPSFLDGPSTRWFVDRVLLAARKENSMVLFISHKEALLDELCDEIIYINAANRTLTTYHCGYSAFRAAHELQVHSAARSVAGTEDKLQSAEKSLKHLKTQLHVRERNFKSKTTQNADKRFIKGKNKEAKQKADRSAASKLRRAKREVEEMEEVRRQARKDRVKSLHIDGVPVDGGTVVSLVDVAFRYGNADDDDGWVFRNVDVCMESNDRVLLKGPNGCGKSTLVRIILGEVEATSGSVSRKGRAIYFPQTALSDLLHLHGDVLARDYVCEGLPSSLTETRARQHLGDFGLEGDAAVRAVSTLSAGQRVRLWLARQHLLVHPGPSLLVLDEISENVDVETRDSLTELLSTFDGAVLVVSHDPDFRDSFRCTRTWELGPFGVMERCAE